MSPEPYFPTTRDLPVSWQKTALNALLNIVYPEQCFICSTPLFRWQDCGICDSCWKKALSYKIEPPCCLSCGFPLPNFNAPGGYICANCELHPPPYSGARSFGRYASELSRIIQELKFKGRRNLVGLVAPLLASVYFENWGREAFDLITPVPLHPKRKGDRGYNQSELLARALSRQIAIPFEHALLRRIPTVAQVGLTHAQRLENVRGAFECRNTLSVADKRILLIDDVFTTGATISSATKTLLDAGALRVSVLTVARSLSDN